MKGLTIYKMTGSGNDFVFLDARVSSPQGWSPEAIQAVCARGTGVGADGIVFVGPGSAPGAARMTYYNSDGSHAAMCGNAALCSTRLAAQLGIAPQEQITLETDAGVYQSRCVGPGERAQLHLAPVATPREVSGLRLAPGERRAALGIVGVPHLIVLVDDVDQVDLQARGRELRFDAALAPAGANINFISPGTDAGRWRMRTYERGVEAETLACGTGAVTAGCALATWGMAKLPLVVITRSGLELGIQAQLTGAGYDEVWLEGEARLVFTGVLT